MSYALNKKIVVEHKSAKTGGLTGHTEGQKPINLNGLRILTNSAFPQNQGISSTTPRMIPRKLSFNDTSAMSPQSQEFHQENPHDSCLPPPPPGFPFLNNCGGSYISYGYVVTTPYPKKGSDRPMSPPLGASTPVSQRAPSFRTPHQTYNVGHGGTPTPSPMSSRDLYSYVNPGGHSNLFDSSLVEGSDRMCSPSTPCGGMNHGDKFRAMSDLRHMDTSESFDVGGFGPSPNASCRSPPAASQTYPQQKRLKRRVEKVEEHSAPAGYHGGNFSSAHSSGYSPAHSSGYSPAHSSGYSPAHSSGYSPAHSAGSYFGRSNISCEASCPSRRTN